MNIELRRIVGSYGIVAGSGNYTLIREVMFNVGKENEYLKDMNSGFYGTFEQAIMGLRRQSLRDGYLSEEESLTTLDTYIEEVVSDVTNTYKIENMWDDEDFETTLIDSHIDCCEDIRYQCSDCGYVLDMSKEDIYKKYVPKTLKEDLSSIDGKRIII